ncbi:hypothetical protein OG792_24245 [Micromonospora sp. NBC_01699]|uniref:hypothetical protein n=1 Tax=Micromonospora sp. NBC_01699 TaxID=2975984 RepID=UPI002E2DBE6D|nr:hypothetical protein [Micromonospora sp. NBC_01699]
MAPFHDEVGTAKTCFGSGARTIPVDPVGPSAGRSETPRSRSVDPGGARQPAERRVVR